MQHSDTTELTHLSLVELRAQTRSVLDDIQTLQKSSDDKLCAIVERLAAIVDTMISHEIP